MSIIFPATYNYWLTYAAAYRMYVRLSLVLFTDYKQYAARMGFLTSANFGFSVLWQT